MLNLCRPHLPVVVACEAPWHLASMVLNQRPPIHLAPVPPSQANIGALQTRAEAAAALRAAAHAEYEDLYSQLMTDRTRMERLQVGAGTGLAS